MTATHLINSPCWWQCSYKIVSNSRNDMELTWKMEAQGEKSLNGRLMTAIKQCVIVINCNYCSQILKFQLGKTIKGRYTVKLSFLLVMLLAIMCKNWTEESVGNCIVPCLSLYIPTCYHPIDLHVKHSMGCQHFGTMEQFRSGATLVLSLSPAVSSSF